MVNDLTVQIINHLNLNNTEISHSSNSNLSRRKEVHPYQVKKWYVPTCGDHSRKSPGVCSTSVFCSNWYTEMVGISLNTSQKRILKQLQFFSLCERHHCGDQLFYCGFCFCTDEVAQSAHTAKSLASTHTHILLAEGSINLTLCIWRVVTSLAFLLFYFCTRGKQIQTDVPLYAPMASYDLMVLY